MKKGKLASFYKENKQLLLFIVLMLTFRSSFADWYDVPTGSMKPTSGPSVLHSNTRLCSLVVVTCRTTGLRKESRDTQDGV